MYGKFFASTFTGSMFGAGADVFAVWGYVIANTNNSIVELNPLMLSAVLGMPSPRIEIAIEYLISPDPGSRNPDKGGRRLIRQGAYQYLVVSHKQYRAIRNEDERKEYNRLKMQESRARRKSNGKSMTVTNSDSQLPVCAHTEAEAEVDVEALKTKELLPPAVIRLPATGNKEYAVTQNQFNRWAELYPGVDVLQNLRAMVGWLEADPKRKKTTGGMARFVNGWLSKEQNRPAQRREQATNGRVEGNIEVLRESLASEQDQNSANGSSLFPSGRHDAGILGAHEHAAGERKS